MGQGNHVAKDALTMTEVELLRRFQISPDGIRVETWPKGSTRFVDDATLALLIQCGACAIVERKAHMGAPENKAKPMKRNRGRPKRVVE